MNTRIPNARTGRILYLIVGGICGLSSPVAGQAQAEEVGTELLGHFQSSMRKFVALAEAMPESSYAWSPGEGVMSVARVYAHVTRYNYMYLADNMGIPAPAGLDVDGIEELTGKDEILGLMRRSMEYVTTAGAALNQSALGETTTLYGREVAKWAVLVQLVSHMNEHLGQSIAYARMNGVVPPWSR